MDIKGIISISGKPGLYKVAAQGRNNIIVQSLENDKKFPAFASDKISALDEISIYTYEKDVPLTEVFGILAEKESYKTSIDHKEEPRKLREYLVTFLPNYDAERVYDTDVKKIFQWYNILIEKGFISKEKAEAAAVAATEKAAEEKTEKKVAPKKEKKEDKKESAPKAAKKATAPKEKKETKPKKEKDEAAPKKKTTKKS